MMESVICPSTTIYNSACSSLKILALRRIETPSNFQSGIPPPSSQVKLILWFKNIVVVLSTSEATGVRTQL